MTTKFKTLALLEILVVYAVIQVAGIVRRSTGIVQWELQTLGWSHSGMLFFVGIPALVIWLTRRNWAEYGVSLAQWQLGLDLGIKAYLVRIISAAFWVVTVLWLKMDDRTLLLIGQWDLHRFPGAGRYGPHSEECFLASSAKRPALWWRLVLPMDFPTRSVKRWQKSLAGCNVHDNNWFQTFLFVI